jgi:hypothetical protein
MKVHFAENSEKSKLNAVDIELCDGACYIYLILKDHLPIRDLSNIIYGLSEAPDVEIETEQVGGLDNNGKKAVVRTTNALWYIEGLRLNGYISEATASNIKQHITTKSQALLTTAVGFTTATLNDATTRVSFEQPHTSHLILK